jgi:hypothetical protein
MIQVILLLTWSLLKLYTIWFSNSKFLPKDEYPLLLAWLFLKLLESYTKSTYLLVFENLCLLLCISKSPIFSQSSVSTAKKTN